MDAIGLRELRQRASEIVRRVEAGESFVVTVSGRPAAVLSAPGRRTWRPWAEVADIFAAHNDVSWDADGDADWAADLSRLDASLRDPWSAR